MLTPKAEAAKAAFFAQQGAPERLDEALSQPLEFYGVRSHHMPNFQGVVQDLVNNEHLSMVNAAVAQAEAITWQMQAMLDISRGDSNFHEQRKRSYRSEVTDGKGADGDTLPECYEHDLIGDDPIGYRNRWARNTLAFLMLPEETRVPMGMLKDGICRAAHFAVCRATDGGLHCSRGELKAEIDALTAFYAQVESYLANDSPELQRARAENPEKYAIEVDMSEYDPPVQRTTYEEGALYTWQVTREVRSMNISLGFMRDVMTFHASNGRYLTFAELPQAA